MRKNSNLKLKDFVYLMLATLANDGELICFHNLRRKRVSLPAQYKQIIENILCAENGFNEEFSILIDTDEYFTDHFIWEMDLSETLIQVLRELKKSVRYDFRQDALIIIFDEKEIERILSLYPDEKIKRIMKSFTDLLVDYIYTRMAQHQFCDYSAKAIINMKKIEDDRKTLIKKMK